MSERLFIYGTLAPGGPNAHILGDVPGAWEEASVHGRLWHHGWGTDLGFPAIDLDHPEEEVRGLMSTSEALAKHWDRLDHFEGEAYERQATSVRLRNGRQGTAYLYVARSA